MDYTRLDDTILIRLVARAKTEALSALYDRYYRLVFSVALNVVHDRALAEEITQDVFLRVWENAKTYKEDLVKVKTWLLKIARNRAIDVLRSYRARPEQHAVDWADVTSLEIRSNDSPQKAAELTLEKERIHAAVAQLPEAQKRALTLAYFQGYTHQEVAQRLDEPLGTVKTRIRRAMLKLRKLLQDE